MNTPGNSETLFTSSSTVSTAGKNYVADQVIVRYNSKRFQNANMMSTSVALSNTKIGATVHKDFSDDGLTGLQVVTLPSDLSVDEAIAEYKKNPDVLYAHPNYIYHLNALTPDDTYYASQWGLHNTIVPGADIAAPDAWGISTGSDSVVVAVIDTGVDYNHPDLAANIWANTDEIPSNDLDDDFNGYADDVRGWNFWDNTTDPMDGNYINNTYHGTHCAGTIGAVGNNSEGIAGVSWNAKIMPLRVADQNGYLFESDAILAINYASANGADIISNSWGGYSNSQALKDAIDISPALVICAAGNDGVDNGTFIPASYDSANIISVAASTNTDQLTFFSNYGEISVDLAAPGVNILSTNISISSADSPLNYRYMHGTSAATPFVAGTAALVKSVYPKLNNTQIRDVVLNNADVLGSLSGKVNTSGRLNANKTVLAAQMAKTDRIGVYRNGIGWFLDSSGNARWGAGDTVYTFGLAGDIPLTGDWNDDLKTEIGAFRNNRYWYLDITGDGVYGPGDTTFGFGLAGDVPLTGDWNGDGKTEIGVLRNGQTWVLDISGNGAYGPGDAIYSLGLPGDVPVTGDWNGDGKTEIGVFRNGHGWFLDSSGNGAFGLGDTTYGFGLPGDLPVTGDWNADGKTEIGVWRDGVGWFRDNSGNGAWGTGDTAKTFGLAGDHPLAGKWTIS
jgi:subtilisin family serine protease